MKTKFISGLVMALLVTWQANSDDRYFAALAGIISPMFEYHPRGEITAEGAKAMPHYRVGYDSENRLSSIRFFKYGRPSDDAYFYTHEVRYTYDAGKRVRSYYGADGQPKAMWRHYYQSENVQREEFTRSGNKVTLFLYGLDGERVEVGTGSYAFMADFGDPRGFVQTQVKRDNSANIIFNYLPFEVALMTVGEHGFLHQILNVAPDGGAVVVHTAAGFAEMRILFDAYGNELGWEFRDARGALANRAPTAVDPGYARWIYEFDWTNVPLGQYSSYIERYETADGIRFCQGGVKCISRRAFDPNFNITAVANFGPDGKLAQDPGAGFARFEADYDAVGHRIEARYFDPDNSLRKNAVAIRRYHYDLAGAQTIEELDDKGQPLPAQN